MIRITQVISDTNIGGAGILVSHICEALSGEFDFTVVIPRASRLKERLPKGISTVELPMAPDRSFRASDIERFRAFFQRQRPDIVHTHAALSARIGAKLSGVNSILSTRHCAHQREEKTSILYRKLYNSVTDLTVSTASFAKKNLVDEGIPADKILTIHNGSPNTPRLSAQQKCSLKEALGIAPSAVVLGSVARLEVIKGQDLMIEALSRLVHREDMPPLDLILVGCGTAEGMYRTLARELGVAERVHFVDYSDTPWHFQNIFDINLNASRGTETSCLATSECMSLGVVTVASDFGGNPEMIRDGTSGLLFQKENVEELTECIATLIHDPLLYLRLSMGARLSYEKNFSIEQMAKKYRELYRACAARTR